MSSIAAPVTTSGAKVSLVGVGQVGMAAAFSILQQVKTKGGLFMFLKCEWLRNFIINCNFHKISWKMEIVVSNSHQCKTHFVSIRFKKNVSQDVNYILDVVFVFNVQVCKNRALQVSWRLWT